MKTLEQKISDIAISDVITTKSSKRSAIIAEATWSDQRVFTHLKVYTDGPENSRWITPDEITSVCSARQSRYIKTLDAQLDRLEPLFHQLHSILLSAQATGEKSWRHSERRDSIRRSIADLEEYLNAIHTALDSTYDGTSVFARLADLLDEVHNI